MQKSWSELAYEAIRDGSPMPEGKFHYKGAASIGRLLGFVARETGSLVDKTPLKETKDALVAGLFGEWNKVVPTQQSCTSTA